MPRNPTGDCPGDLRALARIRRCGTAKVGLGRSGLTERAVHDRLVVALAANTRRRWMSAVKAPTGHRFKLAPQLGSTIRYSRARTLPKSHLACASALRPRAGLSQFARTTCAPSRHTRMGTTTLRVPELHGLATPVRRITGAPAVSLALSTPGRSHRELLPYLVRRLLENGANSSFVHQIGDTRVPLERLVSDPVAALEAAEYAPHPSIPRPRALYGERANSMGVDVTDQPTLTRIARLVDARRLADSRLSPRARVITAEARCAINRRITISWKNVPDYQGKLAATVSKIFILLCANLNRNA